MLWPSIRMLVLATVAGLPRGLPAIADEAPRAVGAHSCTNYPEDALNEDSTGETTVAFVIQQDGSTSGAKVDQSSGDERLDQASLQCISTWRYEPVASALPRKAIVSWKIDTLIPTAAARTKHTCDRQYEPTGEPPREAMIDFVVTDQGRVQDAWVGISSGDKSFDDIARQCAATWTYQPGMRNGVPIAVSWAARFSWQRGAAINVKEDFARPHRCNFHRSEGRDAQGTAVLSFLIGVNGQVTELSIVQSSGDPGLDRLAMQCATRWKYKPATQDGKPIALRWGAQVTWRESGVYVLENASGSR